MLISAATAGQLGAQNFGVHFLGDVGGNGDPVTGAAGVVPITNWNNINNVSYSPGNSTTITASDGIHKATLTISGGEVNNGWDSAHTAFEPTGDGANASLLHGYIDCRGNNPGPILSISGLTNGAVYNLYTYHFADASHPSGSGDHLPNEAINGITNYFPELGAAASSYTTIAQDGVGGVGFTRFIQGTTTLANSDTQQNPANFGNYFAVSVSSGAGGQITIMPEADTTTYRSSFEGFELVPSTGASFGVHFLGNTSDNVTGAAGVVPISNWNNIANSSYISGTATTITGSDGATTATLTLTGSEINNAWNSGLTGDGTNMSLMDGFMDCGDYNDSTSAAVVVTNLQPDTTYTVYVYCMSDGGKPGSGGGNLLPNYNVNGTTYYLPILGATGGTTWITPDQIGDTGFTGFVQGTTQNANADAPPSPASYGNYIRVPNVSSGAGGQITVVGEPDTSTFRSSFEGFELVPSSGASFGIHFLGNTSDNVSSAAGVVPITHWNNINNGSYTSGQATTISGSDGATTATLTLTGSMIKNAWNSGITGDGANMSLMHGFMDCGDYNDSSSATATVTGLPANTSYTVYIYCMSDSTKPGASSQYLPNYAVNGTKYYVPILGATGSGNFLSTDAAGGPFNGTFVAGTATSANTTAPVPSSNFGNYMVYSNVEAVGGTITIQPGVDDTTFRTAFNGFELIGPLAPAVPVATLPIYTPNVSPIYAGTVLTFNESAAGASTLVYQWLLNSGGGFTNIPGANSTNLVVDTTSLAAANYEYEVIVTNTFGASTSAPVTITVVAGSAPVLMTDISPTPTEDLYAGENVTYAPVFVGTLPITYQWWLDTGSGATNVPGATNATLVLDNVQPANSGTYYLTASNSLGGPISSSSSALTVVAVPSAPPSGTFGAWILSNNPVAYWPLNDTNFDPSTGVAPVYDASGNGFDGIYGQNVLDGFDGIVGPQPPAFPGFATNNWAMESQNDVTNSWAYVPPLQLDTNTVTIAMWIYPTAPEPARAGLFFNRPNGAGFGFGGAVNSSGMAELGYTWNDNNADTFNWNTELFPVQDVWSFVVLVVQPNQETIYLYYMDPGTDLPDLYSASNNVANFPAPFGLGSTTTIGTDFDDPSDVLQRAFAGSVSQVAVFNRALAANQILQLFEEGAGLTTPTIGVQPQSETLFAGATASFAASSIVGSLPMTNQWQFNGVNIPGATNTSLAISNITTANNGTYQLFISNSFGSTSSAATLTVVSLVPNSYDAAVMAAGSPLAYYKLDETNNPANGGVLAFDFAGGYNGVYATNAENGYNGILGPEAPEFPGFPSTNTALETLYGVDSSYVSASVGNIVASNLTYVMWINPSGPVENWAGLLFDRGGAGEGLCFGGQTDSTGMSELGYTWNQNNPDTYDFNSGLFPPVNQWSLVALTIQPTQAALYLINTNGVQTAVNPIPHDTEEFGAAWHIGNDFGTGGEYDGVRTFPGGISDVAVYLTALSSNQIVSLFDAGQYPPMVTLTITPTPPGSVTLNWSQGTLLQTTNLAGPWVTNSGATSPYVVGTTNRQMFFRLLVP